MYRINYGNGQTSIHFRSLRAATAQLLGDGDRSWAWVQEYVPDGYWWRVSEPRMQAALIAATRSVL